MNNKSLEFYRIGHQFLNSAKLLLEELIKSDNKNVIISDVEITERDFEQATKYSDFNIMIPILFNYYHGLELIIKGALEQKGKLSKDRHNIDILVEKLKEEYKDDSNFTKCVTEKIDNSIIIISKFESDNKKINGFSIYEALRYPDNRSDDGLIKYSSLFNNGDAIIEDCMTIIQNIENIKKLTVQKYRELKNN